MSFFDEKTHILTLDLLNDPNAIVAAVAYSTKIMETDMETSDKIIGAITPQIDELKAKRQKREGDLPEIITWEIWDLMEDERVGVGLPSLEMATAVALDIDKTNVSFYAILRDPRPGDKSMRLVHDGQVFMKIHFSEIES